MLEKLATFGGKLGLSPADRVRLSASPQKSDDDFFSSDIKTRAGD
jgi:hypothetical protein